MFFEREEQVYPLSSSLMIGLVALSKIDSVDVVCGRFGGHGKRKINALSRQLILL